MCDYSYALVAIESHQWFKILFQDYFFDGFEFFGLVEMHSSLSVVLVGFLKGYNKLNYIGCIKDYKLVLKKDKSLHYIKWALKMLSWFIFCLIFKFDLLFWNYFFKSVDVKKGKSRIWIIIDFCGYTVDPAVFLCGPGSSLNL